MAGVSRTSGSINSGAGGFAAAGGWPPPPPMAGDKLTEHRCAFLDQWGCQSAGYIVRSVAVSCVLSGKYLSVGDAKKSGRHEAGRPHISIVGSLLWRNPIAWPSSCAMTLRGTLGSVNG